MPRVAQDKPYVNFANGFITEATGITFPDNSLQDVDNCDINLRGSIRRRYGLDNERGGATITNAASSTKAMSTHIWDNVAGGSTRRFIVTQIGNDLVIRKRNVEPVSTSGSTDSGSTATLSTTAFLYNATAGFAETQVMQSSSGFGRLWFASPAHTPFYVEYDVDSDSFATYQIGDEKDFTSEPRFFIRDFNGIDDGLENSERQAVLTSEHLYNLLNQGWIQEASPKSIIETYAASQAVYPSNAEQWVFGKDADDNFSGALVAKQDFGNSRAPKGRLKLNPLTGGRDGIASFTNLTSAPSLVSPLDFSNQYDEKSERSYKTTAFFSGRVWFAGDENPKRPGGVYFSKLLSTASDSGVFAQENDPTSEHFTDLLDTDGGVIYIPEADSIEKLIPFQQGLVVIAKNGVWYIRGSDSGFRATDYGVDKLSNTGTVSGNTVIQADTTIAFFAENSIHAVAQGDLFPSVQDIAETKILQFYSEIPLVAREASKGVYDSISKKMFWFYSSDTTAPSIFDRALILDTRTGAYTKYSFYKTDVFGIVDAFPSLAPSVPTTIDEVVIGSDPVVIGADPVITNLSSAEVPDFIPNNLKVLVLTGTRIFFAEFFSLEFRDFENITNPTGSSVNFTSYLITPPETLGDLQRNKQSTYLHSLFFVTETQILPGMSGGSPYYDRPSGCKVKGLWDWHKNASGNRFSQEQQAYRFKKQPTQVVGPLDNGEGIVYTKLKVRGKGRSLAIRYDSEEGKDFVLDAYSVAYTANGV